MQPLGWRSWNLYGANVDQDLIMSQMTAIVSRKRTVNGVPTSLADLGFKDVGYVIALTYILFLWLYVTLAVNLRNVENEDKLNLLLFMISFFSSILVA